MLWWPAAARRLQNAAAEAALPNRLRIEADSMFVPPTDRGRAGPLARASTAAAADTLSGSLPPVKRRGCRTATRGIFPKRTWPGPVFCRGTAVAKRADFAGLVRRLPRGRPTPWRWQGAIATLYIVVAA